MKPDEKEEVFIDLDDFNDEKDADPSEMSKEEIKGAMKDSDEVLTILKTDLEIMEEEESSTNNLSANPEDLLIREKFETARNAKEVIDVFDEEMKQMDEDEKSSQNNLSASPDNILIREKFETARNAKEVIDVFDEEIKNMDKIANNPNLRNKVVDSDNLNSNEKANLIEEEEKAINMLDKELNEI